MSDCNPIIIASTGGHALGNKPTATSADPIQAFKAIIASTGMVPPVDLIADGFVHMFAPDGTGALRDAWYVLRAGKRPAGAFGCKRKGVESAWGPRGKRPAAKDHRAAELSNLRARLSTFSAAIVSAGLRDDAEISVRYSVFMLRTAERMVELGAVPGLDDPLEMSSAEGSYR